MSFHESSPEFCSSVVERCRPAYRNAAVPDWPLLAESRPLRTSDDQFYYVIRAGGILRCPQTPTTPALPYRHHRAPTFTRTARALEGTSVCSLVHLKAVVQKQLFACKDIAQRIERDVHSSPRTSFLIGHTVRRAGMVDVTGGIPAIGRIDDSSVGQPEHIRQAVVPVTAGHLSRGIAPTFVDRQSSTCSQVLRRKRTLAVNAALTNVNHGMPVARS